MVWYESRKNVRMGYGEIKAIYNKVVQYNGYL